MYKLQEKIGRGERLNSITGFSIANSDGGAKNGIGFIVISLIVLISISCLFVGLKFNRGSKCSKEC